MILGGDQHWVGRIAKSLRLENCAEINSDHQDFTTVPINHIL